MSRAWKRVPQTVRPPRSPRPPLLLCLLIFGLTAVVVYRWGQKNRTPVDPNPTYTATAYVVPVSTSASADATASVAAGADARIPLRYTDSDPQRAAQTVNSSAERYVGDRRAEWKRCTDGPCRLAQEAVEKSRQEHVQSTARLEAFRRQLADAAETARARAAVELPKPSAPPTPDNPQWLDLNRQLAALQQRYDQLLADRTPLHPSVQELAGRMAGVKNQLATTPRQVPNTAPHVPDAPDMAASITPDPAVSRADQQTLDNLTAAVERTHRACEEAKSVEKKVLAAQQAGPQFAIEHAQVVENRPEPDYAWRRLILTTFAAGLVMAFGVGFVSIGSDVEPRAASAAEVLAAAGAPLVGIIPANDPLPDPAAASRHQSRVRSMLVAVGLILIAACPTLAIWGVIGI